MLAYTIQSGYKGATDRIIYYKKVLTGFACLKKYLAVCYIMAGAKSASTPSDPCSLETKKLKFVFFKLKPDFSSLFFFNKCSLLGASLFHIDGFRLDNSYAVFPGRLYFHRPFDHG